MGLRVTPSRSEKSNTSFSITVALILVYLQTKFCFSVTFKLSFVTGTNHDIIVVNTLKYWYLRQLVQNSIATAITYYYG